jgi:hypothetical protein
MVEPLAAADSVGDQPGDDAFGRMLVAMQPRLHAFLGNLNRADAEDLVQESMAIANPIVDVVQDGISIQASVLPLEGGATGLSVEVTVADLKRPIPTFTTTLGVNSPVTIQLPQVISTRIEAALELQQGHTAWLSLPALAGVRYLVTLEIVPGVRDK